VENLSGAVAMVARFDKALERWHGEAASAP
jgi:hypothetical protein